MNIAELKQKPLWQLTGEEFLILQNAELTGQNLEEQPIEEKYVYGIAGIAQLFNCSIPTANRIKASGKIDKAITQIGRKIIVDVKLALELAKEKNGGRIPRIKA